MTLGIDLIKALVLNIKFTENIIKADGGPLKGSQAPMVDLGTYEFKYSNMGGNNIRIIFYEMHTWNKYMNHNKSVLLINSYRCFLIINTKSKNK